MIKIKKEWNKEQLNSFYFSTLIILLDLTYQYENVRKIFKIGGLSFLPTNSQINNWRKTKKKSSIFKDNYMQCFIIGLAKIKNVDIDIKDFNTNRISFFYDTLIKIFNKKNSPKYRDLESLILFLHKNKIEEKSKLYII